MRPFLLDLAEKTLKEHPVLEEITFVFPNRRAVLYFRKHLASLLTQPTFAPRIISIEDFVTQRSSLQVPDKLELVHLLYQSYYEVLETSVDLPRESFDQFFFWGDMLLRDFDEVDRYMVNAAQLFKDLSNIKELDSSFDFLDDEQVEFLKSFWGNFDEELSANKKKFLHVWRRLPEVYKVFRDHLKEKGLGYEGMVYREVAMALVESKSRDYAGQHLIFAGFNALTLSEETIISTLVAAGVAKVEWDLDAYYVNNDTQEAGRFFRTYQQHGVLGRTFPKDIPANFQSKKSTAIFGAAQHVGQVKLMAQLLNDELAKGINPEETLIVLPDEKLLLPVLHGISGSVEKLNVTMGFPLTSTPAFNLIEFLIELQAGRKDGSFNHRQVLNILGHPYVVAADPAHANKSRKNILDHNRIILQPAELVDGPAIYAMIFQQVGSESLIAYLREAITSLGAIPALSPLDKEYAFHFLKLINRLEEVTVGMRTEVREKDPEKNFQLELKSFMRLFRQLVRTQKIPFSGEPLKGLQIMGVLETRNLDYKNVFVLSLNEGALPSSGHKASYIPFTLRKAYGLPTAEHQDSIYSYLFYRVLQRAENIFLFYNTEPDILGQGEMSRYLQQVIFESGWKPTRKILNNTLQPHPIQAIEIQKDDKVLEAIANLNEGTGSRFKGISPSALNTYLDCQLKFYFRHIARIKEAKEVEENLDARVLGNFLHSVMERFYKRILSKKKTNLIEASDFDNHVVIVEELINDAFVESYRLEDKRVKYDGQRIIVKEVIKSFVEHIIRHDRAYAPFSIEGLEREELLYYVPIKHKPGQAVVGGKIDRLDRKGNDVRVIDYKTGKGKFDFDDVASLFNRDSSRNPAAFQTMLYSLLYKDSNRNDPVKIKPGLLNRDNLFADELEFGLKIDKVLVDDANVHLPEMETRLKELLEELFDPAQTFRQTQDRKICRYCPYQGICYR
jgi:CRISPR/Cas system-associated exonuclease Cas4 (RecB family)